MSRIAGPSRRLARLAVQGALVLVTVACAVYVVSGLLGFQRYVITGGSMGDAVPKGSIAFEQPRPVGELEVGDVITYLPPADSGVGTLVTHRIVEVGEDETGRPVLRTKGDANAAADPWTFSIDAQTQPVVRHTVPHVGYAVIALADRETRMVLIGIPALLIALLSLVQLGRAVAEVSGRRRSTSPRGTPTASTASAGPLP